MENLAFKDFKGAVTQEEFQAVLAILKEEYELLSKIAKAKIEFNKQTEETLIQIKEQSVGLPPELEKKLVDGLKRRAIKEVEEPFKDKIERHFVVTDFLNRFQLSDELLPYVKI